MALKAKKCFELETPSIFWSLKSGGYLVCSAAPGTFGISITSEKPLDLKPSGAFMALLRKYAPSPLFTFLYQHPSGVQALNLVNHHMWLLVTPPPHEELALIDTHRGVCLVRKSPHGTFTKVKTLTQPFPADLNDPHWIKLPLEKIEPSPVLKASLATPLLPAYQRKARDRIARRVKTMNQSIKRLKQNLESAVLASESKLPDLLRDHLHLTTPGEKSLVLKNPQGQDHIIPLDETKTPGQNLSALYETRKKAEKSVLMLTQMLDKTTEEKNLLAVKLNQLRSSPLLESEVEHLIKGHRLTPEQSTRKNPETSRPPFETPYRVYLYDQIPTGKPLKILVSKSAALGDDLCRAAKGSDLWLHTQQGHGAHVIIKRQNTKETLPPEVIRTAGILALHFSNQKSQLKGEVYVTLRQNIQKKKHLPPGLWLVNRAETLWVSYTEEELNAVLRLVES